MYFCSMKKRPGVGERRGDPDVGHRRGIAGANIHGDGRWSEDVRINCKVGKDLLQPSLLIGSQLLAPWKKTLRTQSAPRLIQSTSHN